MGLELAEDHAVPVDIPNRMGPPKFVKDEAVLARFGKRQQLGVSDRSNTKYQIPPLSSS